MRFGSLGERDGLASLAGHEQEIKWLKDNGTARNEAVVVINHSNELFELELSCRLRELLNDITTGGHEDDA